ncbi:erythroferrone isoform X3 [Rissa tridactyla]|uniref:erythroferrone isoform X3 n=1 Tax=Rissa tridactyla TaxID=75485 RepID=UPI0023BA7741|nr:erythroferrone isoform X3 [Rissa tridactyla]
MRLPELCLALLCAAAGTGSPGSARDQPPGAAGGRAEGAGRGVPGAAAPRVGGVDPRHAWMLLAGSPGRARGSRARGRTGTVRDGTGAGTAQAALKVGVPGPASVPPGTLAVLEELLRELQLLLKAMVKEQAKMRRKAWEGREEEEESGEGNPQAGSHRRVEAAFRCQTRENISIEQRAQRELQLYYIPEREGMFHRGSGLNLTSGQYTAPIAGYYAFTATLHLGEPPASHRPPPAGEVGDGSHPPLCPSAQRAAEEVAAVQGESSAGAGLRAVPLPAQQQSGDCVLAGEWRWPFHYLRHRSPLPAGWAVRLCFRGQRCRLSPHCSKRL